MILQPKTLERLRILINEDTEYRSGPKLVEFLIALVLETNMFRVFLQGGSTPIKN